MISRHLSGTWAAVVFLLIISAVPALATLSATATISATPNGPDFDYLVSVTNTGTDDIGTFWFAWTPPGQPIEYDFLPSAPSTTDQPAGWLGPVSPGFPGYSIEYYNYLGSPLASGQTGTFRFTSSDSPTDLQGTVFGFPITTSFIYSGDPLVGATSEVDPVFVTPEPSAVMLAAIGCLIAARRTRRTA